MPVSVNAIDHFVIRVTDLDAAEALYRRLGFAPTPRGFHVGRGSANHTAPFSGGNYFELIHLPDGATRTRFIAIAEGPIAAVLVLSLGPKTGSQDTITILTPEAFAARYPSTEIPVDLSHGWFAGATFDVTSLDRVESALLAGDISFDRTPSGSIAVVPAAAGALLEFRAA
jgi:catechol 2,3-dioxygenase-like lactoylglutathione lyase family enzyme